MIPNTLTPLCIEAKGRGDRRMCKVDKYGFPRAKAKQVKQVYGFQTNDMVMLLRARGKYAGVYKEGRVAIRASGSFAFKGGKLKWISAPHHEFRLLQKFDGYVYSHLSPMLTRD